MSTRTEDPVRREKGRPAAPGSELTSPSARRLYERKVRNSRLALIVEQAWPRFWVPFGVAGIFVLISLTGAWPLIPAWAHKGLLALFGLLLLASVFPIFLQRWPSREDAFRRIEQKSGLRHRPLSSFEDRLSGFRSSTSTERLWHAHRARTAALFNHLKTGWPRPRVDLYDPFALRALLVLLLFVGLIATGSQSLDRLASAFQVGKNRIPETLRLDAWVTPPLYTRKPPILLADGAHPLPKGDSEARIVEVPENSILIIRVNGAQDARLSIGMTEAGARGRRDIPVSENEQVGEFSEHKIVL